MNDGRKQKLIDLGIEIIADALLNLANSSRDAENMVKRLVSTPKENITRYKRKLAGLKRTKSCFGWRETSELAHKLLTLLQDLKTDVTDPEKGVELVAAFFEADDKIMAHCDDSSGQVGGVFKFDAKEQFWAYASDHPDKSKVGNVLLKLCQQNGYGMRDTVLDDAGEHLPEPVIRKLISGVQRLADAVPDEFGKLGFNIHIRSLARQIKDAELFESTCLASVEKPSNAALISIAEVYLECGEADTAYSWIKKVPVGDTFMGKERDQVLADIHRVRGDTEELTKILFKEFRIRHSAKVFDEILDIAGDDNREDVIANEIALIHEASFLDEFAVRFLITTKRFDDVEEYLLKRADLLNGDSYNFLLAWAEVLETEGRLLVVSMIYRALLISILERARTKGYSHGVRYLLDLDRLAVDVSDWRGCIDHDEFKDQLWEVHGRKSSFWSRLEAKR